MQIVLIGASGGIGAAFARALAQRDSTTRITATHHRHPPAWDHPKVHWHALDASDEGAVAALAQQTGDIDWVINAAGFLHDAQHGPEKTIRQADAAFFMKNMERNALPTLLLARHLTPRMRHGRPAVFAAVSARLGSIGENHIGGWYSYRASKAALNMVLKTLSIELRRTHPQLTVAALHPGTTDTPLSRPFQGRVPEGALFTPHYSVACMLNVLDGLTPQQSGGFWSFDGEALPW